MCVCVCVCVCVCSGIYDSLGTCIYVYYIPYKILQARAEAKDMGNCEDIVRSITGFYPTQALLLVEKCSCIPNNSHNRKYAKVTCTRFTANVTFIYMYIISVCFLQAKDRAKIVLHLITMTISCTLAVTMMICYITGYIHSMPL